MDFDCIVVGGGPVGCAVARDVAAAGFKVLVLEEHREIGEPLQCTGLISTRTLQLSGVSPQVVLHNLTGARVHSPAGSVLDLSGERVYALAVDRVAFDRDLAGQALRAGAQLRTGCRVSELMRVEGGIMVRAGDDRITCRLLIGADGQRSLVARWLQLPSVAERVPLYAAEVELPAATGKVVDLFLGHRDAPGWFGWVIPVGEGRARIGTGCGLAAVDGDRRPRRHFLRLQAAYPELFRGMRLIRGTGGLVPIGLQQKSYGEGAMVVGDAAAQVKPISGGGLYLGLEAARCCAATAVDSLSFGDTSEHFLARYQRDWMAKIGHEIRCGLHHREIYLGMGDNEMEAILSFFNKPHWRRLILKYGDLDYHSRLARKLALAPPWAERFLVGGLLSLLTGGK